MTKKVAQMPAVEGLGANQTASVRLPTGLTYERLFIEVEGAADTPLPLASAATYLSEIRLMVNGDATITIDAADLITLNAYYGYTQSAGVIPLMLARPHMRTIGGEVMTAYGTMGMDTFTLEIDIAGTAPASMKVSALQSQGSPWGAHLRVQRFFRNQGVTGEAQLSDIPRAAYSALAFHIMTASVGDVEVLSDDRSVYNTTSLVRTAQNQLEGRTPQAGVTHIDFQGGNVLIEALPMDVQDFRVNLDFTATGNFPIYLESVQGLRSA